MDKKVLNSLLPNEILALTIYGEARGEPIEGQIAVAQVIMNRFNHSPNKYKNVTNVCLERLQFSCWNDDDPNLPKLLKLANMIVNATQIKDRSYFQAIAIAHDVTGGAFIDNTNGARFYMESKLFNLHRPVWAKEPIDTLVIGNHTFFDLI